MLTKVILEGALGERFGREWELSASSPNEALRLVDANNPGVFAWIKQNLGTHSHYQVICKYEDGRTEELCDDEYEFQRRCVEIRFIPLIGGASGALRLVAGIVLIVIGAITSNPVLMKVGASLALSGAISMLSPKPKSNNVRSDSHVNNLSSFYFNGPVNTTAQGVPVALTYGRCLVGSHVISAAVTVDDLI